MAVGGSLALLLVSGIVVADVLAALGSGVEGADAISTTGSSSGGGVVGVGATLSASRALPHAGGVSLTLHLGLEDNTLSSTSLADVVELTVGVGIAVNNVVVGVDTASSAVGGSGVAHGIGGADIGVLADAAGLDATLEVGVPDGVVHGVVVAALVGGVLDSRVGDTLGSILGVGLVEGRLGDTLGVAGTLGGVGDHVAEGAAALVCGIPVALVVVTALVAEGSLLAGASADRGGDLPVAPINEVARSSSGGGNGATLLAHLGVGVPAANGASGLAVGTEGEHGASAAAGGVGGVPEAHRVSVARGLGEVGITTTLDAGGSGDGTLGGLGGYPRAQSIGGTLGSSTEA